MAVNFPEFEGHRVRMRVRRRRCGRDCYGCPHPTVVAEVTFPSGRVRELWAEAPGDRRRGPPRTEEVAVRDVVPRRAGDRYEDPETVDRD